MNTSVSSTQNAQFDLFVTGGSGLVGQALMPRLGQERFLTVSLGCHMPSHPGQNKLGLNWVTCDLSKPLSLPLTARVVVHVAAEKRDTSLMQAVNVEGTKRLLAWAAGSGVRRFVYLSSVGTYGAGQRAGVVQAGQAQVPRNPYERSKKAAEDLVRDACERSGIQWIILQPSNVVGVNPRSGNPLLGLIRAVKSGRFAYVTTAASFVNYVAVEDVVESLVRAALASMSNRTFIINTPAPLKDFIEFIAGELHVPPPRRRLPRLLAAGMGVTFSGFASFVHRPMPFSIEKFRELDNRTLYEGGGIQDALNFSYPVGWRQMLHKLTNTYNRMGLL